MYYDDVLRERVKNNEVIDWFFVLRSKKLSENCMREFYDDIDFFELNWLVISIKQELSESFIKEFYLKSIKFYSMKNIYIYV